MNTFVPWGQVVCPYCGAGVPRLPCVDGRGQVPAKPHFSRIERAKAATRAAEAAKLRATAAVTPR